MLTWKVDQSWTLFLDRDGVVNVRLMDDYVKTISEFQLLPGVAQAIHRANQLFGKVVVVTNQQGIGKGLMTERNLFDIHTYCNELLANEQAHIDAFYYAPQLASENSDLRKPKTGMAFQAKAQFPEIDFSNAIMIGDSDSDIEFGVNCGMKTVFISHEGKQHPIADCTFSSVLEFIKTL